MTLSFGGGAGVLTIPGVASDGKTPGGIVVAGAVTAGNALAASVPTQHEFYGDVQIDGGYAVDIDGDTALEVRTGQQGASHITLQDDSYSYGLGVNRLGLANGHAWKNPLVFISDSTNDASGDAAVLEVYKTGYGDLLYVDIGGIFTTKEMKSTLGLGIFGHAAPAAQPVLATGAGKTADDVIALLQSYGLCKQA